MKDQHEKIKGYRDLSQEEIDLMNEIKGKGEALYELIQRMEHMEGESMPDFRWLTIGRTDLQKGFMALIRSVAKPTSF